MIDNIIPNSKWIFDDKVADCFENMLYRSIPLYTVMRDAVFSLGDRILSKHSNKNILDIGCSNGLSLERFVKKYGATSRYTGIDISDAMISQAVERFQGFIDIKLVKIIKMDMRKEFPNDMFTLIQSILTVQFIPIEYRQKIIQNVYDNLKNQGAFIMVEKVLGNCSEINEIMADEYLKMKEFNGYSKEQIERKKLSLEGVLVPVTSNWNMDLLKQAGFKKIDVFWRWMNFEGYIAIK